MLDRMQEALRKHLETLELGVDLVFSQPNSAWGETVDKPTLSVYCVELEERDPVPHADVEVRLAARYLVTGWTDPADGLQAADSLLGKTWLAATLNPFGKAPNDNQLRRAANPLVELLDDRVPLDLWGLLGLAPRPSFWIRVSASQAREHTYGIVEVRDISYKLGVVRLEGRVVRELGDLQKPARGYRVELVGTGRQTRSDHQGNFVFVNVALEPAPKVVATRGQDEEKAEAVAEVRGESDSRFLAPLTLRFGS